MKKRICLAVLIICILTCSISLLCSCVKLPKDTEFREVVDCAYTLKFRMKDPESFSVYGTCYYCTKTKDGVTTEYIFVPYRAANSYGAYGTDIAMFIDGSYFNSYESGESDYQISRASSMTAYERANAVKFYTAQTVYLGALQGKYEKRYSEDEVKKGLDKWH